MCFFCGLVGYLVVGSVYPPLNTDHTLSVRPCVYDGYYILCTLRIAAGCTSHLIYTDSGFHKTQNPKHDKGVCTTHIRKAVRYTRVKYMFAIGTRLGLGSREHIRRHVVLCDQKLKLK